MMQPSRQLIPRLIGALRPGGKVVISDGNRNHLYARLLRRRNVLSPQEMRAALADKGCQTTELTYGCAVPAPLARRGVTFGAALAIERWLDRFGLMPWFGASYSLVAEKRA